MPLFGCLGGQIGCSLAPVTVDSRYDIARTGRIVFIQIQEQVGATLNAGDAFQVHIVIQYKCLLVFTIFSLSVIGDHNDVYLVAMRQVFNSPHQSAQVTINPFDGRNAFG